MLPYDEFVDDEAVQYKLQSPNKSVHVVVMESLMAVDASIFSSL
jgi:hypothetical protein